MGGTRLNFSSRHVGSWLLALSIALGAPFGCSSSDPDLGSTGGGGRRSEQPEAGTDDASGGTGSGGVAASGGRPSTGGVPASTGGLPVTASGGRSASSGGAAPSSGGQGSGGRRCSGETISAEALPVDMYVMFDQSSSMHDPVPPPATGTWWDAASQALKSFVNDPRTTAAHPGVGLQYFPLGGVAPASCTAPYGTPEVPIAALPGNAAAIVTSVNAHEPTTYTPTGPALAGAIAHMKAWAPSHPGRAPLVVLVTDGLATECEPRQVTDLARLAADAFESEPRVRTFAVGFNMGASKENLNAIAKAGGTDAAFFIDGGDIDGQFVSALLSITDQPLACSFDLPRPPPGETLDTSRLSVVYTPNGTQEPQTISRLNTLGDCILNGGSGWYLDSPQAPTQVLLCPESCKRLAAGTLKLEIDCDQGPGETP